MLLFGKLITVAAPLEPVIIVEQGGLVVAERGPEILVIDRGNGPLQITAFVLAIVALVFGGFAIVSTLMGLAGSTPGFGVISVVLLAVGIVAGAALLSSLSRIRQNRQRSLTSFAPMAVFDRARRTYRDGSGQIVAALDQVRFERRMQLTSSSPKLVAVTPAGAHVLKRGNPFGGGIGALDEVLTDAVHGSQY